MSDIQYPQRHDYTPIRPFKLFVKSNFPFIEATFEGLDNYGLYCKVVEYLNQVIAETNDMSADVIAFTDFTTNYFQNLDVQEEINNKLDDLVEDGTLSNLISPFVVNGGSPLFVSSTTLMTDHKRNYVLTTSGELYQYNGTAFVSTGYVYGVNDLLFTGVPTPITSADQLASLNNALPNRVYAISTTSVANMPEQKGGTLITFNRSGTSGTAGYVQLYATSDTHNLYFRNYWNNQWYAWQKISKTGDFANYFKGVETPDFDDFNNAPMNTCYVITATNFSHMPVANGGTLCTFNKVSTIGNGAYQIYYTSQSSIYMRIYYSNEWKSWKNIPTVDDLSIYFKGINTVDFEDLNNATPNRCYTVTVNNLSHMPVAQSGILLTFNRGQGSTTNGYIQYYITSSSNELYFRIFWSNAWKEWRKIVTSLNIDEYINTYASLSAFRNIGVIGDSYASGVVYSAQDTATNNYAISWPQMIARKNGVTAKNFSRGGLTTKTWLTSEYGLTLMNSTSAQNLYIVALGLNDATKIDNEEYDLGRIDDIDTSDPTQNEDTFYGNLGKIVSAIITKAPNAKIILSTIAYSRTATHASINTAIKAVANLFEIVYIEPNNSGLFTSTYWTNQILYGHPTVSGYGGMAQVYEKFINDCMVTNYSYFQDYTDDSMESS